MRLCGLFLAMFVITSAAFAADCPTPEGADLDQYPIFSAPLTVAEQAALGLRAMRLVDEVEYLNWHGQKGCFRYDRLQPGTLVLVDDEDNVRYKADCGNRLIDVWAVFRSTPIEPVPTPAAASESEKALTSATSGGGFWSRFGSGLGRFFELLLIILMGALLLGVMGVVALALYSLFRTVWEAFQRQEERRNPPSSPAPPQATTELERVVRETSAAPIRQAASTPRATGETQGSSTPQGQTSPEHAGEPVMLEVGVNVGDAAIKVPPGVRIEVPDGHATLVMPNGTRMTFTAKPKKSRTKRERPPATASA